MSKSLGNVVDPLKLMKQSGADILRLWTMTSDYAEDIRIGQDTIKNTSDLYRRIRNTLRFLLGSIDGFTEAEKVDLSSLEKLPELEQLMLHELAQMDETIRSYIQNYEFNKLASLLHQFCNNELSSFYFDIRKDRLYCDDANSFERRATRTVMAQIFDCLVTWLAPILSFTTEEAWSHRPAGVFEDAESVHLREFLTIPANWNNDKLAEKWSDIIATRKLVQEAIEPMRASKDLGSSLEAYPVITASKDKKSIFDSVNMADICITSRIKIEEGENNITIQKTDGEKCARCWKVLPEVSSHPEHICVRCDDTVSKKQAA